MEHNEVEVVVETKVTVERKKRLFCKTKIIRHSSTTVRFCDSTIPGINTTVHKDTNGGNTYIGVATLLDKDRVIHNDIIYTIGVPRESTIVM